MKSSAPTVTDPFAEGVIAFTDELRRFVRARVRSPADAEDIAQDVMLKVFRAQQTLRDPTRLRAWLYRTARSTIADHFRRRRDTEPVAEDATADDPPDFDRLGQRLQQSIRRFVAALPATYREVVTLADLEGRPLAEVAARLGLSLTATKSRAARGRELLRSRLFACCNFEVDRFGTAIDFQQRQASACDCGSDPASTPVRRGQTLLPEPVYELAQPDDGPAILALLNEAGLPTEDLHAQSWLHFGVARAGERVVGAVGLEPLGDLALLRSLVVAPAARGAGVGRRLLAEARRLARQLGLRELWLLTTTAEAFFAREGFVRIDRDKAPEAIRQSTEFCTLCPDSAAVMTVRP